MVDTSGLAGGSGGAGDTIGAVGTGGSNVTGGGGAGAVSSGASGGTGVGVSGTGGSGTGGSGAVNGAGAGTGTGSPGGSGVSASGLPCDVQTFLGNRCQTCHGAVPAGGAPSTLVTYQNLTAPSKSDPTQTEAAMAVSRMLNTTLPMPPRPGTPATAADVAVLQTWIAAGYPMGSCGGGGGGTADGGVADGGGPQGDPFAAVPVCTSQILWTQGTRGSASMQPGVACINCHSSGGEGPRFALAGTVYPTAHEPDQCDGASGATGVAIVITGADGKTVTLTPNAAGNFSSSAAVTTPYQAKVTYMGRERLMVAAQTSGDCNACHTQSGANAAPGRILLP
jgi:hypothetical protein